MFDTGCWKRVFFICFYVKGGKSGVLCRFVPKILILINETAVLSLNEEIYQIIFNKIMRFHAAIFIVFLISLLGARNGHADTNVLIIPIADNRAGAVFFIDECLTRGLTNSISIGDLRAWATNIIQRYQQQELLLTGTNANQKQYSLPLPRDIPQAIRSIQNRIPSCRSTKPLPNAVGLDKLAESLSKVCGVSRQEAEAWLATIGPDKDPPEVDFWRSPQGRIEAVTISWYIYGIIVGPDSFKPDWEHAPWYSRKLVDGIYLWHGYD
jgi:hypothetical protein